MVQKKIELETIGFSVSYAVSLVDNLANSEIKGSAEVVLKRAGVLKGSAVAEFMAKKIKVVQLTPG